MTLPIPRLDDRTFEDLVREAKEKIPALCPQWTDFNESDPGITLIHLMAHMTETILYRLNRIPDRNYIKFLELMGVKLRPAQPARTWVVFKPTVGTKEQDLKPIPAGTRISTKPEGGNPIIFETQDPLNVTTARFIKICSTSGEQYADHTDKLLADEKQSVELFCGDKGIQHALYLGDTRFVDLTKKTKLTLFVDLETELVGSIILEWEQWDGEAWIPMIPRQDNTAGFKKNGTIIFDTVPYIAQTEVNGVTAYWLRARLIGSEVKVLPRIAALKRAMRIALQDSVQPDKVYVSTAGMAPQPIDLSTEFYPFGIKPAPGAVLYVGSSLFAQEATHVTLTISIPERLEIKSAQSVEEVELIWEYYANDEKWQLLGHVRPGRVEASADAFEDHTNALLEPGTICFARPPDMAQFEVLGETAYYIRARLNRGHYGTTKEQGGFPPILSDLRISFTQQPQTWQHYHAENYFIFKVFNTPAPEKPIDPFYLAHDNPPTLSLGFNARPSNTTHRIYFHLKEQKESVSGKVLWEYRSEEGWKGLRLLRDDTQAFSKKGAIDFLAPADWIESREYKTNGYWMRARWLIGDYRKCPELEDIYLNAVEVIQAERHADEILGSSNNEPLQTFRFTTAPILPGACIVVREVDSPIQEEIEQYRARFNNDLIEETDTKGRVNALWIRWHEAENFFKSNPDDRHYRLDPHEGTLQFGDGTRGMRPPPGRDNIKALYYFVGGGAHGNVGRNTLTVLERAVPFVASVTNIIPASGGADMETVEGAKERGPWSIKHRHRAVTQEDFEQLACEASAEVALACCLPQLSMYGEIEIIIVPKSDQSKPRPQGMLIQSITQYLNERRLINTKIKVRGPEYLDCVIAIDVVLQETHMGQFHAVKRVIEDEFKQFMHPLHGGPEAHGWPMGRTVHISEMYYLLEQIEGVDHVEKIKMRAQKNRGWVEKIKVAPYAFPYFKEINVRQA